MTRRELLVLVSALALGSTSAVVAGCRPAADAEPVDSPGAAGAGSEAPPTAGASGSATKAGVGSARPGAGPELASRPTLPGALVAVAATTPASASPCEQTCGKLGDCLLDDAQYSSGAAGRLELECLDLCVHAPDKTPAKAELLGCGSQACGELTRCAEGAWTRLREARKGPEPAPITNDSLSCQNTCRWLITCMYTAQPPGAVALDEHVENGITDCQAMCTSQDQASVEELTRVGPCVIDNCSNPEAIFECWGRL